MNRKKFVYAGAVGATAFIFNSLRSNAQQQEPVPYKLEIVKEFIFAGHGNLDKVKTMLDQYPNLLYASYDWSNGDFETALEGAGHVGNKEIATYLIEKGARPNIYVMAMLGHTTIVKSILEKYPALLNGRGPHGFTLLHHANKGGNAAKELKEYFFEKGLTETQIKIK